MAKTNCVKCGKEIGFTSQVKLVDGNFLCKDCEKKAGKIFDPMMHSLDVYDQLLKEQERDQKIFDALFKKKRTFQFGKGPYIHACEDNGFMYIQTDGGGLLSKNKVYNMYRFQDLASYRFVDGNPNMDHRMKKDQTYIELKFVGDYVIDTLYLLSDEEEFKELTRYFDKAFELVQQNNKKGMFKAMKGLKDGIRQEQEAATNISKGLQGILSGNKEMALDNMKSGVQMALRGNRIKWSELTEKLLREANISWKV
ncbi:hypothetical protein [Floccifex sp.]|uniref:hypothetical protein n=1 Tax=Floccifex sp. TaxID=2815810 RepID=UPI003F11F9CE